jgi:Spy/CpxP family protein refolding chaperone
MKFSKLILPVLALGVLAGAPMIRAADEKAPAGETKKGGRGGNPDQMIARIDEAVGGLTAEQKTKMKEIIVASQAKMRDAQGDERRTIMQGQRDQLRALLTPEQHKKFDEMPAQGRGGAGGGGGGQKKKKDQ